MAKKRTSAKDVMKPHSEAKVNFYQKYLETHLLILSRVGFVEEIHIYDLFCGRGVYADGKTGSAIRAYETIRYVRQQRPSDKRIVLHLNDKKKKYIEAVRTYIETNYPDEKPCDIIYTNRDAMQMLEQLAARSWYGRTRSNVHNVFFIDPYGYKEVRREFLQQLMSSGNSEILLFLPISFMQRFTSHAFSEDVTPGALPLKKFITSFFPEGHPMRTDDEIDVQTYIEYLTKAFSFGGRFFTTSYPIERNSHNQFALFFFSTSIFGYERVLEIKWKMIDSCGFGFHLPQMQGSFFEDEFRREMIGEMVEQFRVKLTAFMMNGSRTNGEIYKFAVSNGFLPKHAKDVLRQWQAEGRLEIIDMNTGEVITARNMFKVDYQNSKKASLLFILRNEDN